MPQTYRMVRNRSWTWKRHGTHCGSTGRTHHPGYRPQPGTMTIAKGLIMRVFVTGPTGWIGSVVARELVGAGHQVGGLARSDRPAAAATAAGAEVVRGSLEDTDGLRAAAAGADGVIHTGYIHDFSPTGEPAAAAAVDGRALA